MIKLVWRILLLVALAAGFAWLADRPGTINIQWMGRDVQMSVLVGAVGLLIAAVIAYWLWYFISRLWRSPGTAREFFRFRRQKKAYQSLSKGIIAANAGDSQLAAKHAAIVGSNLSDEPLVNVLLAQAAQLKGDQPAVRRAFEAMSKNKETELVGLRGLFSDARQSGDLAAAIGYAERAQKLNPRLPWASTAVLQIQSARKDWMAAAATIQSQGKSGLLNKVEANVKRAALLAAAAIGLEATERDRALKLAVEAHELDPSLVPAALVAARCYIANDASRKAAKVLRNTWVVAPHADLAEVMAHLKPGDQPEARFERVRDLVGSTESNLEAAYALAKAAIAAGRHDAARKTLQPHLDQAQARVCALMAEIEEAAQDKGRAQVWLSSAIRAPRDPMWVADGVALPRWSALSPVTGEVVQCQWKPPFEILQDAEIEQSATPVFIETTVKEIEKPQTVTLQRPPDDPGID